MAHDVFISYSSRDKVVADAVCATLEKSKIRCWIAPRDVPPGQSYGGALVRAIDASRAFVLVFSANANRSPQVMREVERAISHEIPVIPFRIEDVQPSEDIAYFISSIHWLDALTPPLERHAQQLAETVRRFLTEKAEPQPSAVTPEPPPAAEPESPTVKPTPKPSTAVGRGTQIAASVRRAQQIAASVRRAQQIAAAVRKAQQAAAEPEPPTSKPTPEPAPATEPAAPPPSFDLLSTFLADARQTQADLATVEAWFDQLAGGETVAGSGVLAHSIHLPVSVAPGQDPDLADMWDKYHAAIADGQQCLQWLIDFCASGGGTMDDDALRVRRELLSSALRHAEHVVQALEALQ